jgi:rod shape-determining protein MreD
MTRARLLAAITAIITALLLQATVVGPGTAPFPVSLPAVLVAAVALVDGPAAGMSMGFATGLLADLGSTHPAGVLALCWLGVGLMCGTLADRRSLRRDALTAGVVCGIASAVATLLLALVNSAGSVRDAVLQLGPAAAGDVVLALGVVALGRRMLRAESLRAPQPVYTELALGPRRG